MTLDLSKLNKLVDKNIQQINVTEKLKFLSGREKNIVGKGKSASYQHFSFSYIVFKMLLFQGRYRSGLCGEGLIYMYMCQYTYT